MATRTLLLIAIFIVISTLPAFTQMRMCIDAAISTNTGNGVFKQNGVYYESYRWTNGSTIRVKFIGGDESVKSKITYYAKLWEKYANIVLNFVESGDAEIRIAFDPNTGSHSIIGTQALTVPQYEPTLNFGWFNSTTPDLEIKRTTLHEFGHALGLLHEHQNPVSPIKWNYSKAYAYFMQTQKWTKEMVDLNIFNRYSVTQTNNRYDEHSIMIYPIPKELTEDGYGVEMSYDLSDGDKKLIAELYPKYVLKPITINTGTSSAIIQNINVQHNIFRNNKKGMSIKANFQVNNALNKQCKLVAYFYNGTTPLKSKDPNYSTTSGNVAAWIDLTPNFPNTQFTNQEIFVPYDALNLSIGEFKLKCSISIFNGSAELARGGAYYFSYQNGPVCDNMDVVYNFDNVNQQLVLRPKFTIKYAQNLKCNAVAYFYFDDGKPMKAIATTNSTTSGDLAFWASFNPGYDVTNYNYGYLSDLTISIPYSEFHLVKGFHKLKFFVSLESADWKQMSKCVSKWTNFTINIP